MIMIKTFKIFEGYQEKYDILKDLAHQFDNDFVDEFWKDHFMRDAEEIIDLWPNSIWKFIDDDEYISDLIDEEKSQLGMDDFSDYDYIQYIKNNISDKKEKKVLQLFNKKIKNKEDKADEYDDDMLDDLKEAQLKKIIEDVDEEEEFVEYIVTDRYDGRSAEEIADDYGYGEDGAQLYKMFSNYIDDDEIEQSYLDDQDYDSKINDIIEEIYRSPELQSKLMKMDKSNVLLLAKVFIEEPDDDNISKEYKFQKKLIKQYIKAHISEKPVEELTEDALQYILDNFEMNDKIRFEYSDSITLSTLKFNL